jgi:predicted RND superfamily exporter protein
MAVKDLAIVLWAPQPKAMKARQFFRFISLCLLTLQRQSLRRGVKTIAAFALFLTVSLFGICFLQLHVSIEDMANQDFESSKASTAMKESFYDDHDAILLVERADHAALLPADFEWLKEKIASTTQSLPELQSFLSPWSPKRMLNTPDHLLELKILFAGANSDAFIGTPWEKKLIAADHQSALIWFQLSSKMKSGFFGHFDPTVFQKLQSAFESPFHHCFWNGSVPYQHHLFEADQKMIFLNLGILLLLILFFKIVFDSWKLGTLLCMKVGLINLILMGWMGYAHVAIDLLTNHLFLMVTLSTVEDFVLIAYWKGQNPTHSTGKIFRSLAIPCFFTSFTTLIGFFAGLGALLEWVICFLLLPALLRYIPSLDLWFHVKLNPFAKNVLDWCNRFRVPKTLSLSFLLIIPFSIYTCSHLFIQDSPDQLFPRSHPLSVAYQELSSQREIRATADLILKNGISESVRSNLAQFIHQDPAIQFVQFSDDTFNDLVKELPADMQTNFKNQKMSRSWLPSYFSKNNDERIFLSLKQADTDSILQFKTRLEKICPQSDCQLTGASVIYADFASQIQSTLLGSLGFSLFFIFLLLLWIGYSNSSSAREPIFLVALSSLLGPLVTLCFLSAFKIPVSLITTLFACVLVALTGDNTIQFLIRKRSVTLSEKTHQLGGASALFATLSMLVALAFTFSPFQATRELGLLLTLGIFFTFFGDYFLMKSYLKS